MKFENNEELKAAVKHGVLDCKGEDLICPFDIDIEANIINCLDIDCLDITCNDIKCHDIKCHRRYTNPQAEMNDE